MFKILVKSPGMNKSKALKTVTYLTPYCLATGVRSRYHRITNQTKGNAMQRITDSVLRGQLDTIKALAAEQGRVYLPGHSAEPARYDSLHLYHAYGSTGVHATVEGSTAVREFSPLDTKRNVYTYLRGMIAGLSC